MLLLRLGLRFPLGLLLLLQQQQQQLLLLLLLLLLPPHRSSSSTTTTRKDRVRTVFGKHVSRQTPLIVLRDVGEPPFSSEPTVTGLE